MLKQHLAQKQLQKLSPQQIQLMKLLQIPTATLEQRIQEELEANPALEEPEEGIEQNTYEEEVVSTEEKNEEGEEKEDETYQEDLNLADYEDYLNDDTPSYKLQSNNYSPDDEDKRLPMVNESSFQEHLERQLGLLDLSDDEKKVALQIIGSIDDDGYLRREPISIVDDLAFTSNVSTTTEVVEDLLFKIQQFEPAGIGARHLQECLVLQLKRKQEEKEDEGALEEVEILAIGIKMLENNFDEFSKKHYTRLLKQLDVSREKLRLVQEEILKLNPKPGGGYAPSSKFRRDYIIPDFILETKSGELELRLHARNAPELRINNHYKELLSTYSAHKKSSSKKQQEAALFAKQKIDSAKWFIDAIKQRQSTMLRTMQAIMAYQEDYLLTGDERHLKPMILKDISDITGLDISTISRVANSKYIQTEFGTKRLKDFFSESLQTASGEEVSTREVKKILSDLVDDENKQKPLSDEKLKDKLKEKGYNIARRTVAKYREQLGIPVARLRKEL